MSFTSELTIYTGAKIKSVNIGTFAQASGDTGGTVATGLSRVDHFELNGAIGWTASGGDVTVKTVNPGETVAGSWMAVGLR